MGCFLPKKALIFKEILMSELALLQFDSDVEHAAANATLPLSI